MKLPAVACWAPQVYLPSSALSGSVLTHQCYSLEVQFEDKERVRHPCLMTWLDELGNSFELLLRIPLL